MKVFAFVLAACIIGAFAETEEERLLNIRTHCATEHKIGEDLIAKFKNKEWEMDNPNLQCYMKCIMTKMQVMREDGSFDMEKLKQRASDEFPADKVQGAIDLCTALTGANTCEKALKVAKCFTDQSDLLAHAK